MANKEQTHMRMRLRKWIGEDGKKWPNDDLASIDKHIALRDEYIRRYGIKTIGHLIGQWEVLCAEVVRNVERAAKHKSEEERWAREAKERAERKGASDKRIAAERIRKAKSDEAWTLKQARDDIERNEGMVRVYLERINNLTGKIHWVEGRLEQLSDEFLEAQKGTSMYYPLRKRRRYWEPKLPLYRNDLERSKQILVDLRRSIAASYDVLGEKPQEVRLDEMAVAEQPKPKWENRHPFYHQKGLSHANRFIIVDKPNDRRFKRFENGTLVEQKSLTDAEFEAFDVRG